MGPFKVLERKGEVAYRLDLPLSLSGVHDVFHISQLKRCLRVPEEQAPLDGVDVQDSGEDSRDVREGYSEQAHQDVQSSVESPQ